MPPLQGFSDNAFETYADFKAASIALLRALKPYQSSGGARIRLPLATGTHFDDIAAQLEGYARPLWAVGALLHANAVTHAEYQELIEPYIRGLANGTDPNHEEYWGPVVLRDQRMVEMEIASFALLAAPDAMFHAQTDGAKRNITEWLKTINGKDFPTTNWLWFRVMTNLALIKVCGVPSDDVIPAMKEDLGLMERFYQNEGWSADGIWSDDGRQADYYAGSFAIQFSQLIYVKIAEDIDPERCQLFRQRAVEFASTFWRYFDENGAAIPFGRSLTYRFAFAGFWSAVAFAGVKLAYPLNDPGVVKGLLLRHFRWWSDKDDQFNADGTLTIGFTYPNMYMSEDYNSPQSPYWALKSFLAIALAQDDQFWRAEEKPLPITNEAVKLIKPPSHILCNQKNHHYLLSMGQFCPWPLKATEAKYGKFAYSSNFGFSVPTGALIQQIAPDSTLALSKDGGDTWRVPWKIAGNTILQGGVKMRTRHGDFEVLPALSGVWKPWTDADILISTCLIAPSKRWPDWYVRLHKIYNKGPQDVTIQAVQGGFAIQGRGHRLGETLPVLDDIQALASNKVGSEHVFQEGTLQRQDGVLICSNKGASGIRCFNHGDETDSLVEVVSDLLKPDANTNLIWQRTLIPALKLKMTIPANSKKPVSFGCTILALSRAEHNQRQYAERELEHLWNDVPNFTVESEDAHPHLEKYR